MPSASGMIFFQLQSEKSKLASGGVRPFATEERVEESRDEMKSHPWVEGCKSVPCPDPPHQG